MKTNKLKPVFPLIFILSVFVNGANIRSLLPQRYELDQLLMVNAIGVDVYNDKEDKFRITLAYTEPDENVGVSTISASGVSFSAAINNAASYSGRSIYLGQSNMVIIGNEAAKNGLTELIDYITRSYEARLNSVIITACGTAEEILNVKPISGLDVLSELDTLIKNTSQNSLSYPSTLGEVIADFSDDNRYPVTPLIYTSSDENGGPVGNVLVGSAVYKDDALYKTFTGEEAYIFTLLRNKSDSHTVVCDTDNAKRVTSQLIGSQINYDFTVNENGRINCAVNIILNATVIETSSGLFNKNAANELMNNLKLHYEDVIMRFIDECIFDNEDILHIQDKLIKFHPVIYKYFSSTDDIDFTVNVKISIENTTIYGGG